MDKTLTTNEAANMTAEQLRTYALTAPRQLSLFCTKYAAAKDAAAIGDHTSARQFLQSAKTAYTRAMEDEHGQCKRAAATAAVVEHLGAAQSPLVSGGKNVYKIRMGQAAATWLESWGTR
jgi:hypothetical protein